MSILDDIGDILNGDQPDPVDTRYLEEAMALTDAERERNLNSTSDAEKRILADVNRDVEDTDFKADLDELTNYAMQHAGTGLKQTAMTTDRMGVDVDPALQRTMDRQSSLGAATAGVNTRNIVRTEMRDNRLGNMAKGIQMEDDKLQIELDRLAGLQNMENIKAGMPPDGSGFSLGGGLQGGFAAYVGSKGNPWVTGVGAFLGAFL